jgi:CBS domain containing-hemolysin-like protein
MMILRLVILAITAFLSACFSGSETALFSLPPDQVGRMKGEGGLSAAAARLLEHPRCLLTTVLLGNMVVNVLFYSVSLHLLVEFRGRLGPAGTAALGAAAPLTIILFGELLPKNIAVSFARPVSRLVALPLTLFQRVAWPAVSVLERISAGVGALLGGRLRAEPLIRADEMAMLIDLSAREGAVDRDVGEMIAEVVKLSETPVREVMVPRVDMVCFDVADDVRELERLFVEHKHMLIPVYEGRVDNVLGVMHAKDFLVHGDAADVASLLRPVVFLPETSTVEEALQQLRKRLARMALLVDEHGALVGLVAVEDMLEEIVGEIGDEYEPSRPPAVQVLGPAAYRVRGSLSLHDLHDLCGVDVSDFSVDTVGGLVMLLLDRLPVPGDRAERGPLRLTVEKTRGWRVSTVLVEVRRQGEGDALGGPANA